MRLSGKNGRARLAPCCERGLALSEAAIVFPMLMFLMAGAIEFGSYFCAYSTLAKATRLAARHISTRTYVDSEKTIAKNYAVCGQPSGCNSGNSILPGLTASNIQITSAGGNVVPQTVTVKIAGYSYKPIFGKFIGSSWVNVAVKPGTTMRYMLKD